MLEGRSYSIAKCVVEMMRNESKVGEGGSAHTLSILQKSDVGCQTARADNTAGPIVRLRMTPGSKQRNNAADFDQSRRADSKPEGVGLCFAGIKLEMPSFRVGANKNIG